MEGSWFVMGTSLPFWKDRTNPKITYELLEDGTIKDTVAYGKKYSEKVLGIDKQDKDVPNVFHWKGDEWYSAYLSSHWCILGLY